MKTTFLLPLTTFMISAAAYAQTSGVGINTTNPAATLDVVGKTTNPQTAEGIIAPRLNFNELIAKDLVYLPAQTAAIVYVTEEVAIPVESLRTTKTKNVSAEGYYYFDGSVWQAMKAGGASGIVDTNTLYTLKPPLEFTNDPVDTDIAIRDGVAGQVLTSTGPDNIATWQDLPTDDDTKYDADNGLTLNTTTTPNTTFELGGTLDRATEIITSSGNTLAIAGLQGSPADATVVTTGSGGVLHTRTVDDINKNDWHITGNTGITTSNYLGSQNDAALIFRINAGSGALTDASKAGYISNVAITAGIPSANNNSFGLGALVTNTGSGNNAFGGGALFSHNAGNSNSAFGYNALYSKTGTGGHTAFGAFALYSYNGSDINGPNTAVGTGAGRYLSSGRSNTAVGTFAMQGVANVTYTGSQNTALGVSAMGSASEGVSDNVAVGFGSLGGGTNGNTPFSGKYNIALGSTALNNVTTGSNNIAIGSRVQTTSGTANNQLNIGNVIYGVNMYNSSNGLNPSVNPAPAKIGINTPGTLGSGNEPTATLDVNGTARVRDLPLGGTSMVTADGAGNLFTQTIPSGGGDNWGNQVAAVSLPLTGDGDNSPIAILPGTSGQVLTTNSSNQVVWQSPLAPAPLNVTLEQTLTYNVLPTDDIVLLNVSTSGQQIIMPSTGLSVGKRIYVSNRGANNVEIIPNPRETSAKFVAARGGATIIYVGGGEWSVASGF
ncbi:MAG: hypothetical protein LBE36_05380 [Flavobacteriaceae bacterium]|jgi:hypothetical protein|nr:hypothetical protein [Flavobacteriaceae bacterium]